MKPQYNCQWALNDEQLTCLIQFLKTVRKENLKNINPDNVIHIFKLELIDNEITEFQQLNQDFVVINFNSHGVLTAK